MKISRREKILLLIVVYLLVAFGGYRYVIATTQAKLVEVKETNQQLEQLIQQSIQGGKQQSNGEVSLSKEMITYKKLAEQLPQDKQLVELIDQIGKMADNSKTNLIMVGYVDSKQKTAAEKIIEQADSNDKTPSVAGVSKMDLDLSLSGSYYHLLSFLQDLQKSPRIIIVNSASLAVGQKEDSQTGSGSLIYTSTNPPPEAPAAKITRISDPIATGSSGGTQIKEAVIPELTKFDLGNVQMNLKITSYYDTTQTEIEKLIGTSLFKKLIGTDTTNKDDEINAGDVLKELQKTMSENESELKL